MVEVLVYDLKFFFFIILGYIDVFIGNNIDDNEKFYRYFIVIRENIEKSVVFV